MQIGQSLVAYIILLHVHTFTFYCLQVNLHQGVVHVAHGDTLTLLYSFTIKPHDGQTKDELLESTVIKYRRRMSKPESDSGAYKVLSDQYDFREAYFR